jgi:hypothetical protein
MAVDGSPFTQARRAGSIKLMPTPRESTKNSLGQRLGERARDRWPALAAVNVRHRNGFVYLTGELPDGSSLPLCRLRYGGYANQWGFAIYLASKTATKTPSYPAATTSPPPKKPSTAPAVSSSTTPPHGAPTDPRRTSAQDH